MSRINAAILKRRRDELGMSLADVAERSNINIATIHRIERGKTARTNQRTVAQLAKALKVEPHELTAAKADADAESNDDLLYSRSQLNVRVSHEARNALSLVGLRYGMRPSDIIEFAPLLFYVVAEESLKARAANLKALAEARSQIGALSDQFPHITERMTHDWPGEDLEMLEDRSIRARDLRGTIIDEDNSGSDPRPIQYEDGEHNPLLDHLRRRLAAVQSPDEPGAELESWYEGWTPRYLICKQQARDFFGGDEEAADDVLNGMVGLHELPREMRGAGQEAVRSAWIKERVKEQGATQVDLLDGLDLTRLLP